MFASKGFRLASLFTILVMALSMVSIDQAEARRGGSFGSRGTRTFNSAPATDTAPGVTAPVQRTMTPGQQQTTSGPTAQTMQQRNGFGGFGGSLMRGLFFGGLLGLFFGGGFGGFAGFFGLIFQVLIIGVIAALVMRAFARRTPQPAGAGYGGPVNYSGSSGTSGSNSPLGGNGSLGGGSRPTSRPARGNPDELGVKPADLDRFEDMLAQVQKAYGEEDYGALRALTTPEMMGYLSEELGENASKGLKNEVTGVKLLKGDIAESWREGSADYATTAMRYASIDVTRDRATGKVVDGDPDRPTEATELWTFVRQRGGDWKLSAIQEA